jgi:hypothetical protein
MKHIVYMSEIPQAFQNAHSYVWEYKQTTALEIEEQINGWKEVHDVRIFGGNYNKDASGKYMSISTSEIGLEFKSIEAFFMFLMMWS